MRAYKELEKLADNGTARKFYEKILNRLRTPDRFLINFLKHWILDSFRTYDSLRDITNYQTLGQCC